MDAGSVVVGVVPVVDGGVWQSVDVGEMPVLVVVVVVSMKAFSEVLVQHCWMGLAVMMFVTSR